MAGVKGYRNYRGRSSRGKILLAVLLCLVILAAVAVILLQEHIVFDENGRPYLDDFWREETQEEEPGELDLVIEEPEGPPELQAQLVQQTPLSFTEWETVRNETAETNAYAITVKDNSGRVYFDSTAAVRDAVETAQEPALPQILQEEYFFIARLACLQDPIAARADVEGMGLKNTGGYIFYDGNNLNWLDPSKTKTREYLSSLAVECAAMGFDEILLTDFGFPTQGKLDKIAYPEAGMETSLTGLLTSIRTALDEAGYEDTLLSVEIPAETILAGRDENAGLVLTEIAPQADRVYAVAAEEQIQPLSQAVTAAGSSFVPELSAPSVQEGSYLIS